MLLLIEQCLNGLQFGLLLFLLAAGLTLVFGIMDLVNSAVVAVNADVAKKAEMIKAMEKADFASVRGSFRYGNNHFPIQNFYLQDVVKEADGTLSLKTVATIVKDAQDNFHGKCPMK